MGENKRTGEERFYKVYVAAIHRGAGEAEPTAYYKGFPYLPT